MSDKNYSVNIKYLRKKNKLNQTQLARLLNISQATLSTYETGRHEPDTATLIQLAEIFGVSTDVILGYEKPPDEISAQQNSVQTNLKQTLDLPIAKTKEAKILSAGVDKMPARDRERVLNMVRLMFDQYEEYFTERNDDDDTP